MLKMSNITNIYSAKKYMLLLTYKLKTEKLRMHMPSGVDLS